MLYYKLKNKVGQSEAEQRKWQKGLQIQFKNPKSMQFVYFPVIKNFILYSK